MTAENNTSTEPTGNVIVNPYESFVGQTGLMKEFSLSDDDFNAWVEKFELYILLNEINEHK